MKDGWGLKEVATVIGLGLVFIPAILFIVFLHFAVEKPVLRFWSKIRIKNKAGGNKFETRRLKHIRSVSLVASRGKIL